MRCPLCNKETVYLSELEKKDYDPKFIKEVKKAFTKEDGYIFKDDDGVLVKTGNVAVSIQISGGYWLTVIINKRAS